MKAFTIIPSTYVVFFWGNDGAIGSHHQQKPTEIITVSIKTNTVPINKYSLNKENLNVVYFFKQDSRDNIKR